MLVSAPPDDRAFMRRALELASRAQGLTSPNPLVGAVVVKSGSVLGEGYHREAGAPHAEIEALKAAGQAARRGTLYVTLEPCIHQGRTGPCVPVVLAAGISRVVAAAADPNPKVQGRGIAALRRAGVEVSVGILEAEARELNRAFFTFMIERRPLVTLKAALTLDGKIAAWDMTSRWITGEPARHEAHRLRSRADAIAVGIGTLLADDPLLTVRLPEPWPREPLRVIVDSQARTPVTARVLTAGRPERTLIAVSESAPQDRVGMLEATGATVLPLPSRDGRVDLARLLGALAERLVVAVLLEGGAELNAGFLEAGLVDRVALFVAPLLLGGAGAPGLVGGRGRSLKEAFRLQGLAVRQVGGDLLIEGDLER
ncbi:MAG: bifunctional diaminohydroxyphosphoribosylaminopyrimidine deaminase/5-amino-6-(5-phosphoribosylamino)uracil reductase RibD [Candidatus Rokubacteria bacterium]|nr:bifunctional diaminohydroxyphosphoribosylaminopyrimidine deaminase/5-amino-6-(5-phosphoribosylamino)uracil reductase RibD [Candidatus Rokubacteria bacterium]